jgi:hypothetical protein
MYRILCNGLENYVKSFVGNSEDVRLTKVNPLLLLGDLDAYRDHERRQSEAYKKMSDFLAAVEKDERDEMVRVVRMIKRLVYWH